MSSPPRKVKREAGSPNPEPERAGTATSRERPVTESAASVDISAVTGRVLETLTQITNAGYTTFARIESPGKSDVDIYPFELVDKDDDGTITRRVQIENLYLTTPPQILGNRKSKILTKSRLWASVCAKNPDC